MSEKTFQRIAGGGCFVFFVIAAWCAMEFGWGMWGFMVALFTCEIGWLSVVAFLLIRVLGATPKAERRYVPSEGEWWRGNVANLIRRSQQWGSPLILCLAVELAGSLCCILCALPFGVVLGMLLWKMGGDVGGAAGVIVPIFASVAVWNAIKERLRQ